jgi:uroporphyrinogen-III synthase
MKVLYLGLNPKPNTFHYPVIRTIPYASPKEALNKWDLFTHMIITSKTTVSYWLGPWDKTLIAIGEATAGALREKGLKCIVAPIATQEGVIQLLKTIPNGNFFYPHSRRARPNLIQYFQGENIPFFSLKLYDTVFQKPLPVPSLEEFHEIVFTSPSTVEGFLKIYGEFPSKIVLTAIGPVTEKYLKKCTQNLPTALS